MLHTNQRPADLIGQLLFCFHRYGFGTRLELLEKREVLRTRFATRQHTRLDINNSDRIDTCYDITTLLGTFTRTPTVATPPPATCRKAICASAVARKMSPQEAR